MSEMMTVTVYGASDDLIEVEGALSEEFNPHELDKGDYLAFSDGTVLSVLYAKDGCWRINRLVQGSANYDKVEATGSDSDNYSDRVTLKGDLRWVVFGSELVRAKPPAGVTP